MLPIDEKFYNSAKHRLFNGEKLIGAWAQIANPMSAEIMARGGFDFLLIDLEHGPGDITTLITQLQAMKGYGCSSIVRVQWNDFVTIKRVLDTGAYGIHVPYVNTAAEAEMAVKAVKYPPEGIRGIAGSPRALGYGLNSKDYFEYANAEVLMYIALETPTAVENLDDIMKVPGVDGIFIGPMDLATSMGYLGNPGHPEVQKTIRVIEEKVFASRKFLGTVAGSYENAKDLFDRGYQYIVAMSDSIELSKQSYNITRQFKKDFAAK